MATRALVTGGCGFIGSNFVRHLLREEPDVLVTNLDLLTYAGNPRNLEDLADSPRYHFVRGDVRDASGVAELVAEADWVVNFAAESHVDRSLGEKAGAFVDTNVYGVWCLLEALRVADRGARFLQVGTDEVYGSLPRGGADESALPEPTSPYAASKAGADQIALSFSRTHGCDVIVSRCTNNYGPYQYPEKMVPLFITNALDGEPLPLYDGGGQVRDWLRVEDHCRALLLLLREASSGEIYNVGACQDPEWTNRDLTGLILRCAGASEDLIRPVEGLRPGHDERYAVDTAKIRALGWTPARGLEQGVADTVTWYAEHRDWWEPLKSGEYRAFYEQHYGAALRAQR